MKMTSHNHSIKRQLEQILKDTKILCELEPFVKKWSIKEMSPILETTPENNSDSKCLSKILEEIKLESDDKERRKLLEKVKEMVAFESEKDAIVEIGEGECNHHHHHHLDLIPFNKFSETTLGLEYDHELESKLSIIQEIERMDDAVTQTDIDNFMSGIGKPDGPDLHMTNTLEWKNIFLQQWLDLSHLLEKEGQSEKKSMSKHKGILLPSIPQACSIPSFGESRELASFSRTNLDSHFMTRRGKHKNIANCNNNNNNSSEEEEWKPFPTRFKTESRADSGELYRPTSPYSLDEPCSPRISSVEMSKSKRSLLSLKEEYERNNNMRQAREKKKMAGSAKAIMMTTLNQDRDNKKVGQIAVSENNVQSQSDREHHHSYHPRDYYHLQRQRQRKGAFLEKHSCENEDLAEGHTLTFLTADETIVDTFARKTENPTQKASQSQRIKKNKGNLCVRPSSAVPNTGVVPKLKARLGSSGGK